jgi:flagellar basal body-associated protein FliL
MLESMATLILVIIGVVLIIFILGYGIYITFYPLIKTVKGGIDAIKEQAETEELGVKKRYARTPTGHARRVRKGEHRRSSATKE